MASVPHLGLKPKKPVVETEVEETKVPDGTAGRDGGMSPTRRIVIPLWDVKWNKEALEARKAEVGARAYARGYHQLPLSDEDMIFKREWIEAALDRDYSVIDVVERGDMFFPMRRFGGLDLATGTAEKEAAYWVLMTIGVDKAMHRYVLDMQRARGLTLGRQLSTIYETHRRMKWEVLGVETNAFQEVVEGHLKEEGMVPVRPVHTGHQEKHDTEIGVPSLAVEFEQGKWHIPWQNEKSRRIMTPLVEELFAYPTDGFYSDTVMALYFAREMFRQGPGGRPQVISLRF